MPKPPLNKGPLFHEGGMRPWWEIWLFLVILRGTRSGGWATNGQPILVNEVKDRVMSELDIVHKHHNAINAQDEQEYLDSVNFPFTYQNYNTVSITIKDEEDYRTNYQMPWDIIKGTEPNWSHTELDEIEEVARSTSSLVFKLLARRINKSGNTGLVIQMIWIAVSAQGEWGIKFRHNLGTPL